MLSKGLIAGIAIVGIAVAEQFARPYLWQVFGNISGKWKVILIFMAPIALIAVAIVVKYLEVWRARSWIATPGKIVTSISVQRLVERSSSSSNDEDSEVRNFADIVYTYRVDGRPLQGSRLSIGADLGNSGVAEKLARYKGGTAVTVYYDPKKPENAVIERDLPAGSFQFGFWLIVSLTGILFTVVFGADWASYVLSGHLPDPRNAPIVTGLALFSAALAGFAYTKGRQAAAVDAWAQTTGRIVTSATETFRAGAERMSAPQSNLLRQRVTYRYTVAGVGYSSDRVSFGARTTSSLRMLEQSIVRRYPVGATVTVFYDPANPAEAVLERNARLLWLIWASAALFAVGALAVSGALK